MSSAADNFHPGFSPESSLMLLLLAGLLACAASVEPSHRLDSGIKVIRMLFPQMETSTHSYGNSTGLSPVSLLIPIPETNYRAKITELISNASIFQSTTCTWRLLQLNNFFLVPHYNTVLQRH